MRIWSQSFDDGARIPGDLAFCVPDPDTHVTFAGNKNPHVAWDGVPAGTKSFALLCVDPDVPSVGDDVNQEGRSVSKDLPRVEFGHWILVDLAGGAREIAAGSFSEGVTPKGKDGPAGPQGTRQGINNYTDWFGDDPDMGGSYYGYDGPCPPWNDELMHRYVFTLYALDVERTPIEGDFGFGEVRDAIEGHVLASAEITGLYTLNPAVG